MVFTNDGKQFVTWGLGSNVGLFIGHIGIGSGSGTASVSDNTLINEIIRQPITGSPDFTTNRKVSFQGDFNSVQMSGLHLTEFGLFNIGSADTLTGSTWQREGFGSVVFNGTNELQITTTLEVL